MKTLIIITLIILLLTGCDQGETVVPSTNLPLGIGIAFQIINKNTGEDLFLHSDIYKAESINILYPTIFSN